MRNTRTVKFDPTDLVERATVLDVSRISSNVSTDVDVTIKIVETRCADDLRAFFTFTASDRYNTRFEHSCELHEFYSIHELRFIQRACEIACHAVNLPIDPLVCNDLYMILLDLTQKI